MARTYGYGYQGQRYSRQQIEGMSNFNRLNPEIQRRAWAMMDAAQDAGTDLGIGSAWRSRARAQQLYEQYRNGERSAPAAPPDRTYHCEKADGYCYAIDFIGDLSWMNRNCQRFGLRHFANVNSEPWHGQPPELPTACSPSFQGRVLPRFALPGGSTNEGDEFDMATLDELRSIVDAEVNQAVRWAVEEEDGSPGRLVAYVNQAAADIRAEVKAQVAGAHADLVAQLNGAVDQIKAAVAGGGGERPLA